MDQPKPYKELPTRLSHRCFGCGSENPHGLRMIFHTDEKSVFSEIVIPDHMVGWKNFAHGGILSTILDEIMGWSAIYLTKNLVLTKSIAVDFLRPVPVGTTLRAEGRISKVRSDREVAMEGFLLNSNGIVHARGKGVFALFKIDAAMKFGIADEKELRELERVFNL